MCDSNNKNAGLMSFTLGTLLGVGAGFFLSTKKGRKCVKEVWKKVEPYVEDAGGNFEEIKEKGKATINEALTSVGDLAKDNVPPKIKNSLKKSFFKGV